METTAVRFESAIAHVRAARPRRLRATRRWPMPLRAAMKQVLARVKLGDAAFRGGQGVELAGAPAGAASRGVPRFRQVEAGFRGGHATATAMTRMLVLCSMLEHLQLMAAWLWSPIRTKVQPVRVLQVKARRVRVAKLARAVKARRVLRPRAEKGRHRCPMQEARKSQLRNRCSMRAWRSMLVRRWMLVRWRMLGPRWIRASERERRRPDTKARAAHT